MLVFEVIDPEYRHLIPRGGVDYSDIPNNVNQSIVEPMRGEGLTPLEAFAIESDFIFLIFLVFLVAAGLLTIYLYGVASEYRFRSVVKRDVDEPRPIKYSSSDYIYIGWRRELRNLYLNFLRMLRDRGVHILNGYTAYEVADVASKADIKYAFEVAKLYNYGMFSRNSNKSILDRFRRYLGYEG